MSANAAPSIARASAIVGLGNIASRVLGLLREMLLARLFGPSGFQEAFNNALLVSRSIFDLLIAGHVNSAIVPVLSEVESTRGRDALWQVVAALGGLLMLVISAAVLLLMAGGGVIAGLIGGTDDSAIALTAELIRLTAPALLMMCMFALYNATLYALRIFTYPAMAAAVFNSTMILVTLLISGQSGSIYGAAIAWIAAAAAQLALQIYGLRSGKLRLSFNFRDPLVAPVLRRVGRLYVPVIGSLIIDLATTRLLTYALAAQAIIAYGNTYMTYATALYQFPQGLVATSISAAVLPTLARVAGEADKRAFNDALGFGLRLTTVMILPAAAALAVLAVPIIQLLYQNGGSFGGGATDITAIALRCYLIGLPFAAWDLLLIYAFYARQDTFTPAAIGIFSFVVYTAAALLLFPIFDLYALMLADAVKHIAHTLASAFMLIRRHGWIGNQRLVGTLVRSVAATLGMAGAAMLTLHLIGVGGGDDTLREIVTVAASLAVCGVVYAGLAYALRLEEFRAAVGIVMSRLGRRS